MKKLLLGLFSVLILIGCDLLTGKEVGRLAINQTSNNELIVKETMLELKTGEKISFWTETDIEYEDDLALGYTVEVWEDTVKLIGFQMDALDTNPTIMEVKTTIGNKTKWSYTGKMSYLKIDHNGTYTFKAVLNSSDNSSLIINKAELVLKN